MILIEKKDGLGLIVPAPSFNVTDLETHVGSMRELDVIDVDKQLGVKMLMRSALLFSRDFGPFVQRKSRIM